MKRKKDVNKQQMSRKWFLVLLITILSTLACFLPPLISVWVFGDARPLVILSGIEWVSIITMVSAAYIGGNVWQKREEYRARDFRTRSFREYREFGEFEEDNSKGFLSNQDTEEIYPNENGEV